MPLSDLLFDEARDSEGVGLRERSNFEEHTLAANVFDNNAVDSFFTALVVGATPVLLSNAFAGEINMSRREGR